MASVENIRVLVPSSPFLLFGGGVPLWLVGLLFFWHRRVLADGGRVTVQRSIAL